MDINLVLEGGGVRGIALVGALTRFEEEDLNVVSVAGTSAGSIVASLYAAGYSSSDMNDLLMKTSFADFLDAPWIKSLALWRKFGFYRGRRLYVSSVLSIVATVAHATTSSHLVSSASGSRPKPSSSCVAFHRTMPRCA